jgi:hypothetical protein
VDAVKRRVLGGLIRGHLRLLLAYLPTRTKEQEQQRANSVETSKVTSMELSNEELVTRFTTLQAQDEYDLGGEVALPQQAFTVKN